MFVRLRALDAVLGRARGDGRQRGAQSRVVRAREAQTALDLHAVLTKPESDAYAAVIDRFSDGFDVIVVDGLVKGRTRLKCVRAAVRRLREGGMIILDNSDWLPESSRLLRESGLIEVDMTGFAPINDYSCTTSFYFHRGFGFKPLTNRQPMPGIGAHRYNWERGAMQERLNAAGLETSSPSQPRRQRPD